MKLFRIVALLRHCFRARSRLACHLTPRWRCARGVCHGIGHARFSSGRGAGGRRDSRGFRCIVAGDFGARGMVALDEVPAGRSRVQLRRLTLVARGAPVEERTCGEDRTFS